VSHKKAQKKVSPAKTQRRKASGFFASLRFLCAFASLREKVFFVASNHL